jgi:hypothetical protein
MNGFQEWDEPDDRFDCAITISAADWASTKKAWVPQRFKFPDTPQYVPSISIHLLCVQHG